MHLPTPPHPSLECKRKISLTSSECSLLAEKWFKKANFEDTKVAPLRYSTEKQALKKTIPKKLKFRRKSRRLVIDNPHFETLV